MGNAYVRTIEDLEKLYYSTTGSQYVSKVDAPVLTSTTGVYNATYGAMVWSALNQEANAFGVIPKTAWQRDGWRVQSVRAAASGGGLAEAAALPDTIKPTFQEVSTKPKSIAHTFESSEVQQFEAKLADGDAFGAMEQMRPIMGNHHKEMMNVALLTDNQSLAGDEFESLDRVCASNDELTTIGGAANSLDIYGLDRDGGASFADAYVNSAGANRALTDALIRDVKQNVEEQGGNPTVWLTGHDTYSNIQGLYADQVRYNPLGIQAAQMGVNGIQSKEGYATGYNVSTLYGLPVILSKDAPKDGSSRIYLLDLSDPEGYGTARLSIDVAKPTQYFEAGMDSDRNDPFSIDKLSTKGMYRTMAELKCRNFKAQGKLRDLSA